jgi:hypothetical protein
MSAGSSGLVLTSSLLPARREMYLAASGIKGAVLYDSLFGSYFWIHFIFLKTNHKSHSSDGQHKRASQSSRIPECHRYLDDIDRREHTTVSASLRDR